MKYEMKIEVSREDDLKDIIEEYYFRYDNNGKLSKRNKPFVIENSDPLYIMLRGLNNMTVRLTCEKLIDGSSRFVVDEHETHINLLPCSIYCIVENSKYSFY